MPIVIVGAAAFAGGLAWKFALGGPQTALLVAGGGAVILLLGLLQLNKARRAAAPKPAAMPEPVAPSSPEEVPIPEGRLAFLKKPIGGSKEAKPKKEKVKKERVKKERVKRQRGRKMTEPAGADLAEAAVAAPAPGQKAGRFAKMKGALNKPIGGKGKEKPASEAPAPPPVAMAPAGAAPVPPTPVVPETPIAGDSVPPAAPEPEPSEQDRHSTGAIVHELQETAAHPRARRVCSYCWEPNDPAHDACFNCNQPLSLRAS